MKHILKSPLAASVAQYIPYTNAAVETGQTEVITFLSYVLSCVCLSIWDNYSRVGAAHKRNLTNYKAEYAAEALLVGSPTCCILHNTAALYKTIPRIFLVSMSLRAQLQGYSNLYWCKVFGRAHIPNADIQQASVNVGVHNVRFH